MTEPCEYCGRFMKHVWYLVGDEPDNWQDYWKCSQQDKHVKDHPRDFGYDDSSPQPESETTNAE